jgi:adenylylsulfate kinase
MDNIHPDFEKFVSRVSKELLLNQRAKVLWFTGLSGSGKSTVAAELDHFLAKKGFLTSVLDGDNVRTGINANLGFSEQDRTENIRRIAEVAKLMVNSGLITICCFVSPLESQRNLARNIVGADNFIEVFVDTPIEICEQRDVKGLYKKARAGEIKDFTGINAPFETPVNANCIVKTKDKSVYENAMEVYQAIEKGISI